MGLNRFDLQQLADIRIQEAKVLLDNGCYQGAYYLTGYAVECALKACIARKVREFDFPDKDLASKVYVHDLAQLLRYAGIQAEFDNISSSRDFTTNWAIVKDWSERFRYETSIAELAARGLYDAVTDSGNGVLTWLKRLW